MTDYAVKVGLNQALVDLVAMTPQPRSTGVQAVDRTYSADGSVYEQGQYIELRWDVIDPPSAYADLLAQFGLTQYLFAEVTVFVPGPDLIFTRYNGIAVRPAVGDDMRRENYFVREIVMLIKSITAVA